MTIGYHLEEFAGYKVEDWEEGKPLQDLENTIYRIAVDYDSQLSWEETFQKYLQDPNVGQSRGLVLGAYSDEMYDSSCESTLDLVIAAKGQLPLLEALFVNDITYEENEISWIVNADNAPIIHAFPKLKHFGSRGGNGLSFSKLNAPELETLIVQSGGLSAGTINDITTAELPKLKHLEIYLGTEEYGYDASIDDLEPIFAGRFNLLTYLGLKNCDDQDEIAKAIVHSPVLAHLETLDLSLGTMGDKGAQAILDAVTLGGLKHLDLAHHYMSDEMMGKIEAFAKQQGFTVDVSDQEEADQDDEDEYSGRYVSIGE